MDGLHPVEQPWKRLPEIIESWPNGSVPVPAEQRIDGLGCFPCGYGLWEKRAGQPPPPIPTRTVMLVGNNWGNTEALRRDFRRGENPDSQVYWGTLRPLLEGAGIAMRDCFATNAYPGLLTGDSNVGEFPGADNEQFQTACREFMVEQIRVVRPVLIVALGLYVPPFLSALSPDLGRWRNASKLKDVNGDNALIRRAVFEVGSHTHTAAVVALTHPSRRWLRVGFRQYGDFAGDAAERRMLEDAARAAGF